MWLDDDELTAPAIVISSLGGLVQRKGQLTAKDVYRARMLRQMLKKQLGPPRRLIPRTLDSYYARSIDDANRGESASYEVEVSQHRLLPGQEPNGFLPDTNEAGLCTPASNLRTSINLQASMSPSTAYDYDDKATRISRKRGWRAQGLLAGEWRDRYGRHRRACHHSDKPQQHAAASSSAVVAEHSMASIPCNASSCAGTEVSFEGLIEELRKRLPHSSSSLLEMVAAQHSVTDSAFEWENTTAIAGAGNPPRETRGGESDIIDGDIEPAGGRRGHDASNNNKTNNNTWNFGEERLLVGENCSPLRRRGTMTRGYTTSTQQQQQQQQQRGLLPRGCVQLRPMVEPFRASPPRQALSTGFGGGRLRHAVGSNPSLLLGSFSHGGGGNSGKYLCDDTAAATAIREENVSPSAAMVAAAKAQERALPLLQVCAAKVVEPAGG